MAKPIIEIENLSKKYRLGLINHGTLFQDLQSFWARMKGQDDPNSKVSFGQPSSPRKAQDGQFWALRGVNLTVNEGERVGIIGANGAGKSTMLKILSRITRPSSGEVRIFGRCASLLEVGTGFHPELTGRENIFLNGAILGMKRHEIKKKFDEIVEFSGVADFLNTPVKRYSSGMYVRLAFAVAAHLEPEILVVDEVLAVGDAVFQKKCLGKMQEVSSSEGRTILFVSHNLGAVSSLCNRCVFLKDGQIEFDGAPDQAIARYLNSIYSEKAAIEYVPNESLEAQVMKVRLINSRGEETSKFDVGESFAVEIEYEVRHPVTGAVVSLGIFTQNNECLLGTADHDLDRSRLQARKKGTHKTRVELPGNLLNSGRFYVVIGISIPGRHIYDRQECLQFEVVDRGSFIVNGGGEERRNSILLIPIPWEVEKANYGK